MSASHDSGNPHDDRCTRHGPRPLDPHRVVSHKLGTTVFGWPSTGGLWVRTIDEVESEFLSIKQSAETQRYSQEEDTFCQRLEWIGATFFQSDAAYKKRLCGVARLDYARYAWYAWPGVVPDGGLWALWTDRGDNERLDIARISEAQDMQGRCDAVKLLGGRYYAKFEDAMKEVGTKSDETKKLISDAIGKEESAMSRASEER